MSDSPTGYPDVDRLMAHLLAEVQAVLGDERLPDVFPAQIVDPPQGKVLWIVDQAAASLLDA